MRVSEDSRAEIHISRPGKNVRSAWYIPTTTVQGADTGYIHTYVHTYIPPCLFSLLGPWRPPVSLCWRRVCPLPSLMHSLSVSLERCFTFCIRLLLLVVRGVLAFTSISLIREQHGHQHRKQVADQILPDTRGRVHTSCPPWTLRTHEHPPSRRRPGRGGLAYVHMYVHT